MKPGKAFSIESTVFLFILILCAAGCASTESTGPNGAPATPWRYKATDGRTVEIGHSSAANGGRVFKEPHMDQCWIADGMDFQGFDAVYIKPIVSTAAYHDDERIPHQIAMTNLLLEICRSFDASGLFKQVVTNQSDVKPGARVLTVENTITQYSKGGGAARYFAGVWGGGQPNIRVLGKMSEGDKTLFRYDIRRSGVSGGARMFGAYMKDEDIQYDDIRSLVLDLTDFMEAIAGKYQPRK